MPDTAIDYQQLAIALLQQQGVAATTTKSISSTPTTTYAHGPGGLFSAFGLSRQLFSAMILPVKGLQAMLPVRPSQDMNPLHGIITGVTATSGSEPNGVCDDPPTAGLAKLCTHSFVFGRFSRQTQVYNVDRFGELINRGEFTDFEVAGNPFLQGNKATVPMIPGGGGAMANVARSEVAKAMFELAVAWARDFAQKIYEGNPSNNTAGGGYQEFYGLNYLINTGYRDAITGQACAAADALVRSFANGNISTTGSSAIVDEIAYIMRFLQSNAYRMGLAPVTWAIAMTYELFYELTKIWPCAYMTNNCISLQTGSTNFVDAGDQVRMRDEMRGDLGNRTGQFLWIDGQKVPVVLDDAIDNDGVGSGTYVTQMYFVPLTALGSVPLTYFEYFNYDGPNAAMSAYREFAPEGSYQTTDGGRFLWHRPAPNNFCVKTMAVMRPRLILETPYLAARLTNIRFTPRIMMRSGFTDSPYFVDGGRTDYIGYGPSYYAPTT